MLIFGLGSGQCGLASLHRLLAMQPGSLVTKETAGPMAAWQGSLAVEIATAAAAHRAQEGGDILAGDVATYHLPYAFELSKRYPRARFVCLRREFSVTVDAFAAEHPRTHRWLETFGRHEWIPTQFWQPQLGVPDVRQAAEIYVRLYYDIASVLAGAIPGRFRVFPTEALDAEAGQREILEFCGVSYRAQVVRPEGINVQASARGAKKLGES